jgi:hypothetical protein
MTDERIDFSELVPPDAEVLARAIEARTASVLAERRARGTIIQISAWWQPVAAAAVVVAMASMVVLALSPRPSSADAFARSTPSAGASSPRGELARALGVPRPLAVSLSRETPPTAREFLRELGR